MGTTAPGIRRASTESEGPTTGTVVKLNLYDLPGTTKLNNCCLHLGFGAFHSGLEIFGLEFSYGLPKGIFMCPPKRSFGCAFRTTLIIGRAEATHAEFVEILRALKEAYTPELYHVLNYNCHHFCNQLSQILTNQPIPGSVNKLAKFVAHFSWIPDGTFESKSTSQLGGNDVPHLSKSDPNLSKSDIQHHHATNSAPCSPAISTQTSPRKSLSGFSSSPPTSAFNELRISLTKKRRHSTTQNDPVGSLRLDPKEKEVLDDFFKAVTSSSSNSPRNAKNYIPSEEQEFDFSTFRISTDVSLEDERSQTDKELEILVQDFRDERSS